MLLLGVLILLTSGNPSASDASLETQLRQEYVGSQRMLRHFDASEKLSFDTSGNPLHQQSTVSWTVAGAVVIEKLKLDEQKLEMQGHRRLVTFDHGHKQLTYQKSDKKLSIEIALGHGPNQTAQLRTALAGVFAEQNELPSLVSDYWRDYLARFSGGKSGGCESGTPSTGAPDPDSQPAAMSSHETSEGNLIKTAEPYYVRAARKAGIQGDVLLNGLITKTGDVTNICIAKALGAGLDDSAIEAVRQWRYSPYLMNGQPVEVETTIKITFQK